MSGHSVTALIVLSADGEAPVQARSVLRKLRDLAAVPLRGLGQLTLVETAAAGALVVAAIALISPWCAFGAVAGSILGTAAGLRYTGVTREEWRLGLAGFNCAVIGIMAGGIVATDSWRVDVLLIAVSLCFVLELGMRRVVHRWALPVLTLPSVTAVTLSSLLLAPAGTWLWVSPAPPPLGTLGVALAVVCIVLAMASKNLAATLQAAALACVAILICDELGIDPLSVTGLWAFTIAPASFTVHAVFMGGSLLGGLAGLVAALTGVGVWMLWYVSGMSDVAPPMLAPFVFGVWCALLLFRRLGQPAILQPAFWQALLAISSARLQGTPVVAIIADSTQFSSAPPLSAFDSTASDGFAEAHRLRREWWHTCHVLRERTKLTAPNAVHQALALLQRYGFVAAAITFSVDGRLRRAGATNVVELQGRLETVRCRGCNAQHPWPPANIWRTRDLHCSDCGGLMMPGPFSMKESFEQSRYSISRHLARDGVLVVIGTLQDSRAARMILGEARVKDARVVNIAPIASTTPLRAGDILVRGDISPVMRTMAGVLMLMAFGVRFLKTDIEPAEPDPRSDRK